MNKWVQWIDFELDLTMYEEFFYSFKCGTQGVWYLLLLFMNNFFMNFNELQNHSSCIEWIWRIERSMLFFSKSLFVYYMLTNDERRCDEWLWVIIARLNRPSDARKWAIRRQKHKINKFYWLKDLFECFVWIIFI